MDNVSNQPRSSHGSRHYLDQGWTVGKRGTREIPMWTRGRLCCGWWGSWYVYNNLCMFFSEFF